VGRGAEEKAMTDPLDEVLDSARCRTFGEPTRAEPGDGLDAARRMAVDGLARAFEEAEAGRDWFAMKAALGRVDDAVQAVWYAARVRDDGRR